MSRGGWLAGLAAAAILVALRCWLPPGVFWTSDAGNKTIVAENFVAGGFRHLAIAYPAAPVDPAFRWFPTGGEHFRRVGNGFYSIVSPVFPLVSAPFIALFGAAGATVLPLLAGIGIALLLPRFNGGQARAPVLHVFAVMFATPLAFYSLDFWEHTTAAFFATLAVLLLMRERPLLAGVACGASIAFREEGYVFLIALLIASAARRRVAAGAAVVVVPLWIVQWIVFGNPFGVHLASHAGVGSVSLIAHNVYYFLFQFHERLPVAAMLAIAPLVAIVSGFRRDNVVLRRIALALMLVASVAGVVAIVTDRDPIVNTIDTQGLLLFVPFVAIWLSGWRDSLLTRVLAIYVALMPLVLRANWSGIIWGPRYFLTIMPLLVVASLAAMPSDRLGRVLAISLFVVSAALELFGLNLLRTKLEATAQVAAVLRAAPKAVITDVFWLPEEMGAMYFSKQMMMPPNDRELAAALGALQSHGIRDVAFVTSRRYRWYSDGARRALWRMSLSRVALHPKGVPLLDVDVASVRLPP